MRPLAETYVKSVPQELGAPNVITGILLTFRAFDTLGEVAVLFMVAAGVGLVLSAGSKTEGGADERRTDERKPASELVQNGAEILLPLIFIFAAYIIMNGHLSAGGGFQGGAVIASGVMLLLLAKPATRLAHDFLSFSESLAGVLFVSGRRRRADLRRRLSRQPRAAARPVRRLLQRRRHSRDLDPARHQGRCRTQRHHRPLPQLNRLARRTPVANLPISTIVLTTGFILMLIGLWGMFSHRNILRIIIGVSLLDTGIHIVMVAIGYVTRGTAPIIDKALPARGGRAARGRSGTVRAGGDRDRDRPRRHRGHARLCDPAVSIEGHAFHRRLHGIEMVASLLHPLNIFIVGLGGGFLIPILNRFGPVWVRGAFLFALVAMTVISGVALFRFLGGAPPIEVLTGGAAPPVAINLRLGLAESVFTLGVNVIALLGAVYFVRAKYSVLLLYLILVMGIQGMVMTRDLFNLFVFLEIVSIGTYGLLSLQDTPQALVGGVQIHPGHGAGLGLLPARHGTGLLHRPASSTSTIWLAAATNLSGPFGFAALMLLLACLLIELKPFPANGWGLDVYETAQPGVAALVSVGVSAGVFFALLKLLPIFEEQLLIIAISGAITFVFSNLIGLAQTKARRLLGYSSIGQMGLLVLSLGPARDDQCRIRHSAGGGRAVRQSPVCQGRIVLARRNCRRREARRLVGARASSGPAAGVRDSSGGGCGPSAVPGLLGEVAARDESRRCPKTMSGSRRC